MCPMTCCVARRKWRVDLAGGEARRFSAFASGGELQGFGVLQCLASTTASDGDDLKYWSDM